MVVRKRKVLLSLALASAVTWVLIAPAPETRDVASAPVRLAPAAKADAMVPDRVARVANGAASMLPGAVGEMPPRSTLGAAKLAFLGAQSWLPPTPAVAVVTAIQSPMPMPPPPAPPAMPYRYAGQLLRDGQWQVFVAKDDKPVAVKLGDSLDGYVVESIAADVITLVYPPLGNKAIITISPAQSL